MTERQSVARHAATYIEAADVTVWHCGNADVAHVRVMGDGAIELSASGQSYWYVRQGWSEDDCG